MEYGDGFRETAVQQKGLQIQVLRSDARRRQAGPDCFDLSGREMEKTQDRGQAGKQQRQKDRRLLAGAQGVLHKRRD